MLDSIFYILTLLVLFANVCIFKRTNNKLDFCIWFPFNILLLIIIDGCISAVFSLVNVSISIFNISIANLCLSVAIIFMHKKRGIQKYCFNYFNFLYCIVIVIIAVVIFIIRFGFNIVPNFASVDGSHHMSFAYNILLKQKLSTNMCLSSITEGLTMQFFSNLFNLFDSYKVFLCCQSMYFCLSGLLFYSLMYTINKKRKFLLYASAILLLYYLGYPLYTLIFGFSYLSLDIVCLTGLIFFLLQKINLNSNDFSYIVILNLLLASVGISYTLFVPEVYLAVLIWILSNYKFKIFDNFFIIWKKLFSVFMFPSFLTLMLSFNIGADLSSIGANGGIAIDGNCFCDLYSSFVILSPLSIYAIYCIIKKEKLSNILLLMSLITLFFSCLLFVLFLRDKCSIYYFSKNNSVLWLFLCLLNLYSISKIIKNSSFSVLSVITVLFLIIALTWTDFDQKLLNHNYRSVQYKINNFAGVHDWNRIFINNKWVCGDEWINIYKYIYENTESISNEALFLGSELNINWSVLSFQHNFYFNKTFNEVKENIDCNTKFFIYEKLENDELQEVLKLGDVVLDNDVAVVVRVFH